MYLKGSISLLLYYAMVMLAENTASFDCLISTGLTCLPKTVCELSKMSRRSAEADEICLEFEDKILMFAVSKQRLLQRRETEASFPFYNFLPFYYSPRMYTRRIMQILYGQKNLFKRSSITPPKVNRFVWNLENCEPNVGGWPWQILGAIRAVATVWETVEFLLCYVFLVMRITHDFTDFPSDNFYI